MFILAFHKILWKNPNELFDQPNKLPWEEFASLPIENLLKFLTNGKKVQHHRRCWAVLWSWAHLLEKNMSGQSIPDTGNTRNKNTRPSKYRSICFLILAHPFLEVNPVSQDCLCGLYTNESPESLEAKESGWKNGCHFFMCSDSSGLKIYIHDTGQTDGPEWDRVETRV